MPPAEPQHYWPFDRFKPVPAKAANEDTEPDRNTVVPFQISNNNDRDDLAFAPVFFEVDGDGDPKAPSLTPEQMTDMAQKTFGN